MRRSMQVYATMREKRCERNVITYGSLVNAADRAGRSKLVLELYEEMHRDGCSPNLSTYNCLLHACAQGEDAQPMRSLRQPQLSEKAPGVAGRGLHGAAIEAAERLKTLIAASTSMSWAVTASSSGQLKTTRDRMMASSHGFQSLLVAINQSCEIAGAAPAPIGHPMRLAGPATAPAGARSQLAADLLDRMRQQRCKPDLTAYTHIITAHNKAGQWRSALQLFEHMQHANCRPDALIYSLVVDVLWATGIASAQAKAVQVRAQPNVLAVCDAVAALTVSQAASAFLLQQWYLATYCIWHSADAQLQAMLRVSLVRRSA